MRPPEAASSDGDGADAPLQPGQSKDESSGFMIAWAYPRYIAHRGAGKLAPENTLAAMRAAMRSDYRMVEFDVQALGRRRAVPAARRHAGQDHRRAAGARTPSAWVGALEARCRTLAFAGVRRRTPCRCSNRSRAGRSPTTSPAISRSSRCRAASAPPVSAVALDALALWRGRAGAAAVVVVLGRSACRRESAVPELAARNAL